MHVRNTSTILVLAAVLLLAQTVSVVDAAHKSKNDPDPRKESKKKTDPKKVPTTKQIKNDEKRKAFQAYKVAFDAWIDAKVEYKNAKKSGVQIDIDAKKVILDAAKTAKDAALKEYNLYLKWQKKQYLSCYNNK